MPPFSEELGTVLKKGIFISLSQPSQKKFKLQVAVLCFSSFKFGTEKEPKT